MADPSILPPLRTITPITALSPLQTITPITALSPLRTISPLQTISPITALTPITALLSFSTLSLLPTQVSHAKRVSTILDQHPVYFDCSGTGWGKTYVAIDQALKRKLNLFIVCPKNMISIWMETALQYGVTLTACFTWEKMSGRKKGCNHIYLNRHDDNITITSILQKLINSRTLFIFDECHKAKNVSTGNFKMARTIVRAVCMANWESASQSKVGLLSATPADKIKMYDSLIYLLGIIQSDRMYTYDHATMTYNPTGVKELYEYCHKINPVFTNNIIHKYQLSRKTIKMIIFDLYVGVIKGQLVSSALRPDCPLQDMKNGFYESSKEDERKVRNGLARIRRSRDEYTNRRDWGMLTNAMMEIEEGKINTIIRLSLQTLTSTTNFKVCIYMWYDRNIAIVKEKLLEVGFTFVEIHGSNSIEERKNALKQFNQESNKIRVFISKPTIAEGYSIDDRSLDGKYPRIIYIVPSYRTIQLHQAAGRICRALSTSPSYVRMIYTANPKTEIQLLTSIRAKSKSLKDSINTNEKILFPGDYENVLERDDHIWLL